MTDMAPPFGPIWGSWLRPGAGKRVVRSASARLWMNGRTSQALRKVCCQRSQAIMLSRCLALGLWVQDLTLVPIAGIKSSSERKTEPITCFDQPCFSIARECFEYYTKGAGQGCWEQGEVPLFLCSGCRCCIEGTGDGFWGPD